MDYSIGGALSSFWGGQNDFNSNVQGPNAAAYGAVNGNQIRNSLLQQYAPTVHTIDQPMGQAQNTTANLGQYAQDRGSQQALAQQLQQTASGQGPSVAAQQLKQGQQDSLMAQLAAQSGQRGGGSNPFLAQRALMDQAATGNQALNAQLGQQRASEALNAQQSLGGLLQGMAGQSSQNAFQQAGLNQQTALQNAQNQLSQAQFNTSAQNQGAQFGAQLRQQNLLAANQIDQQNRLANIQQAQDTLSNNQYNNQINAQVAAANAGQAGNWGQKIFQGATGALSGGLGMLSDERAKTNINRDKVGDDMHEFLSSLDAGSWDYKDQRNGPGRHYGVMAQSTERTPVGRTFTFNGDDGYKRLDVSKATGVTLAALAHLHKRQSAVEHSLAEKALEGA